MEKKMGKTRSGEPTEILHGEGVASMMICNTVVLKIRIKDEDTVEYQFIGIDDETVDPIEETKIQYEPDDNRPEDDAELHPCFYTSTGAGPYFISDFVRDNYPNI
jgi:hypothetical protein